MQRNNSSDKIYGGLHLKTRHFYAYVGQTKLYFYCDN